MATIIDIKSRINGVKDTQKITNAMYLIASTKLKKANSELDLTRPYFNALKSEIKRIFRISEKIESKYYYPVTGEDELPGSYGYLVITADKGLAGSYNQSIIKEALKQIKEHEDPKIYVVGEYGRHYFNKHGIPIEESFVYTSQNPSIHRAREISQVLLDNYDENKLSKIFVIYTDMKGAMNFSVSTARLLPFHRAQFVMHENSEKEVKTPFEFLPSVDVVLENIVPSYVTGFIYSALVDSFCSEQNSRMSAMDSANRNAQKIIDDLTLQYNHLRQNMITQEITEISSAAKNMKRKAEKRNQKEAQNNDR